MPAFPYRTTTLFALAALSLLALAILLGRSSSERGFLIEERDPLGGIDQIRVDVGGHVLAPGVYVMQPGDRIADAIARAGGPTAEGDLAPLNLARRVIDEDRIRVPARGERALPLDLNRATRDQLQRLPGVGPVRAEAILEARAAHTFTSSDELLDRDLVPPSVYLEIRDRVATPTPPP